MIDQKDLEQALRSGEYLGHADASLEDREIDASLLRRTLINYTGSIDPRGLRMRNIGIQGDLDLSGTVLPFAIQMVGCNFSSGINLENATTGGLSFAGSNFHGLNLASIRASATVNLVGIFCKGMLLAGRSRIDGRLALDGSVFDSEAESILLDGARILGGLTLNGSRIRGEVRAVGSYIDGILSLQDCVIENITEDAVCLDRARITGSILARNLGLTGAFKARSMVVDGSLNLSNAVITSARDAVSISQSRVGQGADLTHMSIVGDVNVSGVQVGAYLSFRESVFTAASEVAVSLSRASIDGRLDLTEVVMNGALLASGIQVEDLLLIRGATLVSQSDFAMVLDGAAVRGGMLVADSSCKGGIRAIGTSFGRTVEFRQVDLFSEEGIAFDDTTIGGDFSLVDCKIVGEFRALNAQVRGQLRIRRSALSSKTDDALSLNAATVSDLVVLEAVSAVGSVQLVGLTCNSGLILAGISVASPDAVALSLEDVNLGSLKMIMVDLQDHGLDLNGAQIKHLKLADGEGMTLPPLVDAQGISIGGWSGALAADRKLARAWLDTLSTHDNNVKRAFQGQPWRELARLYKDSGRPEDARWLQFWAARRLTSSSSIRSKVGRAPYALLVGYGFYPLLVVPWLLLAWLCVFGLVYGHQDAFTPTAASASTVRAEINGRMELVRVTGATAEPPGYPRLRASIIALETAVPAVSAGQNAAWRVTGNSWLPLLLAAFRAFGWLLTALLLAGLTGILRKD